MRDTDKLKDYYKNSYEFLQKIVERCEERFSKEDIERLDYMIATITDEMIPELDPKHFKKSDRR